MTFWTTPSPGGAPDLGRSGLRLLGEAVRLLGEALRRAGAASPCGAAAMALAPERETPSEEPRERPRATPADAATPGTAATPLLTRETRRDRWRCRAEARRGVAEIEVYLREVS